MYATFNKHCGYAIGNPESIYLSHPLHEVFLFKWNADDPPQDICPIEHSHHKEMIALSVWYVVRELQHLDAIFEARPGRYEHSHIVDELRVCKEPMVVRRRFLDHFPAILDQLHFH